MRSTGCHLTQTGLNICQIKRTVLYTLVEFIITFSFFFSGNKFPMPLHQFTAAPLPGWNCLKLFCLRHPNLSPLTGQLSRAVFKGCSMGFGCGLWMAGSGPSQSLVSRTPGKITRTNDVHKQCNCDPLWLLWIEYD